MKKFTPFTLLFLFIASIFFSDVLYAQGRYGGGGSGSKDNPFEITSLIGFYQFRSDVNANHANVQADKYFKLMADISVGNLYPVVGSSLSTPFKANFNGNGHTLSISIKINNSGASFVAAPFGYVKGSIENLSVNGVSQYTKSSGGGGRTEAYVAGIAAYLESSEAGEARISNCRNFVSVSGDKGQSGNTVTCYVGGIVGYLVSGIVENSYNTAASGVNNSSGKALTGDLFSGGICGYNEGGKVKSCFNSGDILNQADGPGSITGGLLGKNTGEVSYSFNLGKFTGTGNNPQVGGLIGWNYGNGRLLYSYHFGFQYTGSPGNSGVLCGKNEAMVENCYVDRQVDIAPWVTQGIMKNSAPLLTRQMIGNSLQSGIYNLGNPEEWIFEEGKYPRIKGIQVDGWVRLAAAPFILADPDHCKAVNKSFYVDTNYDIWWRSTNEENLKIKNDSAILNPNCTQTVDCFIWAYYGDTLSANSGSPRKLSPIYAAPYQVGKIDNTGQIIVNQFEKINPIPGIISPARAEIQWERSTDGINYTAIEGANFESYTPIETRNGDYYYRRYIHSLDCNMSGYSEGVWKLQIKYAVEIISLPSDTVVCYNTPAKLSIDARTAGAGLKYVWEKSINQGATWIPSTDLGSNTASISTSNITSELWYRCQIWDTELIQSPPYLSPVIKVSAYHSFSITEEPGDQTACSGVSVPFSFKTQGGSPEITYQWRGCNSSSDCYTLSNENTETAIFRGVTTNTLELTLFSSLYNSFQCVINDNYCKKQYTTLNAKLNLETNSNTGAIQALSQRICWDGTPAEIVSQSLASGVFGNISYQWQLSMNGEAYTNISGATAASYTPPKGMPEGRYSYRRIVTTDQGCYTSGAASAGEALVIMQAKGSFTLGLTSDYNGFPLSYIGAKDAKIEIKTLQALSKDDIVSYAWQPSGETT